MRAVIHDIWDLTETHWIVIPTNLQGPMGRGLAYQAKERFPDLERAWKTHCKEEKTPRVVFWAWCNLIMFPVKHHWKDLADLELIEASLKRLSHWTEPVALPQIGCGFGERDWETEIEPLVEKYLGGKNNFLLVLPPANLRTKYPRAFKPGARQDRS